MLPQQHRVGGRWFHPRAGVGPQTKERESGAASSTTRANAFEIDDRTVARPRIVVMNKLRCSEPPAGPGLSAVRQAVRG